MGKKSKADKRALTAKELEGVCLHCAFFTMHGDKWPDWKANGENVSQDAFNDLVRSAVKIVAEIFTMLAPMDQMQFQRRVMNSYMEMQRGGEEASPEDIREIVQAMLGAVSGGGPTKH
jgi:hypothetical protein